MSEKQNCAAIHFWIGCLICCLAGCPNLAAQNQLGASPLTQTIVGNTLGQGNPVLGFTMYASGSGGGNNANVKFKLASLQPANNLLVVSPSSGITPLPFQVGVNPFVVGTFYPGRFPVQITFTTVDQSPPSITAIVVIVDLGAPEPSIKAVVNSASLQPVVTPGAMVSILGSSLGANLSATFDSAGLYPTSLGNTTVTFNGIPAPLLSMSPGQINAVAPYEIAGQKTVQVVLSRYPQSSSEQSSAAFTVPETDTSLSIFGTAQNGTGQPGILNCGTQGCSSNGVTNPAPPGSIIVFFATAGGLWSSVPQSGPGESHVDGVDGSISILGQIFERSQVSLTIGGQPATVLYAGSAPFQVWGILQVNAIIPTGLASGPQPLVLTIGGASTALQPVTVAVQ